MLESSCKEQCDCYTVGHCHFIFFTDRDVGKLKETKKAENSCIKSLLYIHVSLSAKKQENKFKFLSLFISSQPEVTSVSLPIFLTLKDKSNRKQ